MIMRRTSAAHGVSIPSLAALRCGCGSSEVMALRPGQDAARRGAVDLFSRLDPLVDAGAPDAAWCMGCWTATFARPVLSAEVATA